MLVLSRKPNEKIVFPSLNTTIQVVSIKSGVVRLGIEAPRDVTVLREEVQDWITDWAQPREMGPGNSNSPGLSNLRELNHLLRGHLNGAGIGFALVSGQLKAGLIQDAEATVAKMSKEFQLVQQQLEAAEEKPPPPPPTLPFKMKALLVEDNPNERELLAVFLRMAGVDVDMAGDGADALDYLRGGQRPDVVLLDMGLPRCDGPTTVQEIRRDPALGDLKIIGVSGRPEEDFNLGRGPAGVDRWFQKPLDPGVLLHCLNRDLAP